MYRDGRRLSLARAAYERAKTHACIACFLRNCEWACSRAWDGMLAWGSDHHKKNHGQQLGFSACALVRTLASGPHARCLVHAWICDGCCQGGWYVEPALKRRDSEAVECPGGGSIGSICANGSDLTPHDSVLRGVRSKGLTGHEGDQPF